MVRVLIVVSWFWMVFSVVWYFLWFFLEESRLLRVGLWVWIFLVWVRLLCWLLLRILMVIDKVVLLCNMVIILVGRFVKGLVLVMGWVGEELDV